MYIYRNDRTRSPAAAHRKSGESKEIERLRVNPGYQGYGEIQAGYR